jgi:beta-glucosidase/6-phospho-beta-glucosidase/beta-galactosidase
MWITFNEPQTFMTGYASDKGFAPAIKTPGIGNFLTAHTVQLAHANIYHMYEREFKEAQQGRPAAKSL